MHYKRVFTKARFQTRNRNTFRIDERRKRVLVGGSNTQDQMAYIGKVIEQGRISTILDYGVYCDVSFPHVIGIFGSRGSGKSFDLGVFLEGIYAADGASTSVVCSDAAIVFDIQDQFWTLAYQPSRSHPSDAQQLDELRRWGLTPHRLPADISVLKPSISTTEVPGTRDFSLSPDQISDSDFLAILELERFSPMGQAFLTLIESEGKQLPSRLSKACSSRSVVGTYQQVTVDGLRWRLDSLAKSGIISEDGIGIEDLLHPGRISILLMRNLSDSLRALIVGVISRLVADKMGRIQQSRKVSRRTGQNSSMPAHLFPRKVWMVLDEAHVLVPSDGTTPATTPMIDYVKRGRDAGLSLIFATQQPSAVNSKLMSQVDMTLTHTLGFEADLSAAIGRMPTRSAIDYEIDSEQVTSIGDVIRSLTPGEAILADGASGRAFLVKMRPRFSAHGGETPS